MAGLTQDRLKRLVHYDPNTGQFTRLIGLRNGHQPGPIGGKAQDGHIRLMVDYRLYRAHRLAWFYMTGMWPTAEIDHKDGDRTNNRWANLRDVPRRINGQNMRKARQDNLIGLLGVSRNKKRWMSRIQVDGVQRQIGTFDTPELAHAAYVVAKRVLHEGCTI